MLRAIVRHTGEWLGTASGLASLGRWMGQDSVTILAYHNVVPPDEAGRGDQSLHLPLPTFVEQIDHLSRTHRVVSLDAIGGPRDDRGVDEPDSGPGPGSHRRRPRAVITFDDAYRGAVRLALPELDRRGLPATVFVAPELLGTPFTWWDAMGEAGLLTPEARRHALEELGGMTEKVQAWAFEGETPPALPTNYGIAGRDELKRYCGNGVSVGSHSWAHEHLPNLGVDELDANLKKTLEWLRDLEGPTSRWLALPYGAGGGETSRVALDSGHTGVLRIEGGRWIPSDDRSRVPRINVPAGLSRRGLALRTSGLKQ